MQFLKALAVSASLLLVFASAASAFEITMTTSYGGETIAVSDSVVVDVFIDTEAGLVVWSGAVLYDPDELFYDSAASAALPPQAAGPSGAQPSYILYTGGRPSTILYPQQTPAWLNWPAPPADKEQVNINWAEKSLAPATASGTGIYVASMVFETTADGTAVIELCTSCGGNVLDFDGVVPPSDIPLNGTPITVTVPEPAVAGLALAGLATLYFVRQRRRA
jgi:hypothetical protein